MRRSHMNRNKYGLNEKATVLFHPLFNAGLMPSIHQRTIKQTIKYARSRAGRARPLIFLRV